MKKKLGFLIILMVLMVPTRLFGQDIKLIMNEKEITTSVSPVIDNNGYTLVPLRVVSQELGADITYHSQKKEIQIIKDHIYIKIAIGDEQALVNEKSYILATSAKIIGGKTMVPLKFISENLGAQVRWDGINKVVLITFAELGIGDNKEEYIDLNKPEIQVPKEYMDQAIKEIENKIVFKNDIEIFTLYAFMNFTGYDDENNKNDGFSDVRESVRKDLEKMDLQLKNNSYYKEMKVKDHYYTHALASMTKSPEFSYGELLPNYLTELNDLPEHLSEFYKKANIEELYKKYEKEYQQELDLYKKEVYPAIAKMNYYLRVENKEVHPFIITTNLLDAYWRGSGLGRGKYLYHDSPMIITGPSSEPNIPNIVHEYLHGVINPITDKLERDINRISYKRKDVPQNSQADSYGDWESIVNESIIRGIEGKAVNDNGREIAKAAYNHGFILSMYFYERFDEFIDYEGSLENFVQKLLNEYEEYTTKDMS